MLKSVLNQLQKHLLCVIQITGSKKNRVDAIRLEECAVCPS